MKGLFPWRTRNLAGVRTLAAVVAAALSLGCRAVGTPPVRSQAETAHPPVGSSPDEARRRIESTLSLVLDAHHFVPPAYVDGSGSVRWALSSRSVSPGTTVLVLVKVVADRDVTVQLLPYAHVGSAWALLGPVFRGETDSEAREMEQQIRERLVP